MKVATWNFARCRPGHSARATWLRDQMARIPADVWVLTETHRDFSPGSGYVLVSSSANAPDRDTAREECWVAIWARLPATRVDLSADLERCAAIRLTSPTAGPVIVGTVLPWLTDARDPKLRGEAAFRARLADQAADWKRLLAANSGGLCVTGDFNQDLLTTGRYYGSGGGREALRETLAAIDLDCLTGGADDPLGGTPELASIDHICIGGRMRVRGFPRSSVWPIPGELPRNYTDHDGVWADLED